jgi:hypothetical protein
MEPEDAMVEHEVNVVVFAVQRDPHLAGLAAKARAEFEEERLQIVQERGFVFRTSGAEMQLRNCGYSK